MCSWALRGVVDVIVLLLFLILMEMRTYESNHPTKIVATDRRKIQKTMLQNLDAPQWLLGRFWQQERQQITLQQYTLFQDIHIVYSKDKKRVEFFSR
jgi:hypothetical protein